MTFVGKLVYLALFPGLLFLALAGIAARAAMSCVSVAVLGGSPRGPSSSVPGLAALFRGEAVAAGGSLHAVVWIAPALKLAALSWASCLIFGLLDGDVTLLYTLLVLAAASDLLLCVASGNPRVRNNARSEALVMAGWALPLAAVLATLSLRTGAVSVSAMVRWQLANGVLLGSSQGGALQVVGTALAFASAALCAVALARVRPLGRGLFSDPPAGLTSDLSGAPLALSRLGEGAMLFLAPLLLTALFLGGPASTWYEVAFWALKVSGLVLVMAAADLFFARAAGRRAALWACVPGGTLALAALAMVWLGVR